MFIKVGIALVSLVLLFLGYVSTRNSKFKYERSGIIKSSPERIFPYLSTLSKGKLWVPFDQVDPSMIRKITGEDARQGAVMEFEGNREAGSGRIEILNIVPNEKVELKLTMLKPFYAENLVVYSLTPEADGTRFTWTMSGDGGFMGKLMTVLIDCEKMIADRFTEGIANLKTIVESERA